VRAHYLRSNRARALYDLDDLDDVLFGSRAGICST
jgi:hypothetical protein